MLHSTQIMATRTGQNESPDQENEKKAMQLPTCSSVKDALTDLKEILSRSVSANGTTRLETAKILANIEATITSIEEKSLAHGDFPVELGVPTVSGLTSPVPSSL